MAFKNVDFPGAVRTDEPEPLSVAHLRDSGPST